MDRRNEMLAGEAKMEAFLLCLTCANNEPCTTNNWVITCDKDGVHCDNYDPQEVTP